MTRRVHFREVFTAAILFLILSISSGFGQNDQAASQEQASPNNPPGNTPGTNNGPGGVSTDSTKFDKKDYLTGDWDGLRWKLFNDGFTFTPVYIGEVMGNPSGGKSQGIVYDGLLNLTIDFDLEKMTGGDVKDLTIHANAFEIQGRSLSTYYTGDFSGTSSIAGYDTIRLDELWVQKLFWDKLLSVKVGNIAVDTEFFQSSSAGLFIGSTFGAFTLMANNLPNPPVYPTASPGLRFKLSPTDDTYLLAGVFGMNKNSDLSTNNQHGTLFALDGHSGVLLMAEVGYLLNQGPHDHGLQGSYRLGTAIDTGNFSTFSSQAAAFNGTGQLQGAGTDYLIYGVVDQQVYVKKDASISVFTRAGGSPANVNFVNFYCDGGCNFAGFVPGRPDDIAGLAIARSHVSPSYSNAQVAEGFSAYSSETFLEATYRVQLQPWWSVQPVVQYIVTPSGERGSKNATVLGIRTSLAF